MGKILRAILLGGMVAGTIDIGAAAAITGFGPLKILQIIAGGLLGPAAMQGGTGTQAIGLLTQWGMSLIIAAIYVLAGQRVERLRRDWLPWGIAYGVGIFAVMNYVVVPLSAWDKFPKFTTFSFLANFAAMLLFGGLVSYFGRQKEVHGKRTASNSMAP